VLRWIPGHASPGTCVAERAFPADPGSCSRPRGFHYRRHAKKLQHSRHCERSLGHRVVFRPVGARPFLDPPADEFFDRAAPLDEIWCSASRNLRDCLLEAPGPPERLRILGAELQRRVGEPRELQGAVRYALEEFGRNPRAAGVLEVARHTGFSRRRLTQLFREQVGLTHKVYCRLHRFQLVVSRIASGAPVDWSQMPL
jgi:hypothetical protein